uniref:G_PROTEIN_RECEP_F1_2 domain-containing protein n=1 Tax=Macrostomum lignano TaxID=282301 RepID=A0A1I8JNS5_9PLAT
IASGEFADIFGAAVPVQRVCCFVGSANFVWHGFRGLDALDGKDERLRTARAPTSQASETGTCPKATWRMSLPIWLVHRHLSAMNETYSLTNVTYCTTHMFVAHVLFSLVVLLGFFGNLLVITPIHSSYSASANRSGVHHGWVFGHAACVLFQYFTYVPVYGSVYTLVLMSADRYLAVVHPIRSIGLRNQRKHPHRALPATWLLISVCHVPFAVDVGVINMGSCRVDNLSVRPLDICANRRFLDEFGGFSASGKLFYTLFGLLGYLLAVPGHHHPVRPAGEEAHLRPRRRRVSKSGEAARSKRRVTRMVVIVIVIFGTCWLPIHVVFAFADVVQRLRGRLVPLPAGGLTDAGLHEQLRQPHPVRLPVREFPASLRQVSLNPVETEKPGETITTATRAPSPPASTASAAAHGDGGDGDGDGEGDDDGEDGEVNGEGASANAPEIEFVGGGHRRSGLAARSRSGAEPASGRELLSEEPDDEESKPLNNTLELSAQVHRDCLDS